MQNIGTTIKTIRINKNLKQTELFCVEQSTLSEIENNKRIPSIETFQNILDALNINYTEFFYIHNNFQLPEKERLFNKFRLLGSSLELKTLKKFNNELIKFPNFKNNLFIQSLSTIIEMSINLNNHQNFNQQTKEIELIMKKISSQEVYYHNDIYILSKIFFVFPIKQSDILICRIKKELAKYKNYPEIESFKITLLINISIHYIHTNRIAQSKNQLEEAKEIAIKSGIERYNSTIDFLFLFSIYENGNKDLALNELYKITFSLEKVGKNMEAQDMINDFREYIIDKLISDILD
ncbi:helix-turn-helix domain-containing protein [Listeria ivanovii]|uniref:helix-turn-helix domain-containing protein n=1 Tax=Listeria ivanovii TaxID=1638 RepID=UPI0019434BBB|nr:helix-turn-helix transcriptional regulator [Listeria ivanovii]MBM5607456.1 XRE family transcriptional regulator [Listeria ivanovii]MBM5707638.1 XRE family transcriptional regulator [Listeria ivanovii]